MDFCPSRNSLRPLTGVERIFSNSTTGVRHTIYRSSAYIFSAATGVPHTFYRSLPYIFPRNHLLSVGFWKHILLTMMLKNLKTSPRTLMPFSFRYGEVSWK